jgi:hypothetical protein
VIVGTSDARVTDRRTPAALLEVLGEHVTQLRVRPDESTTATTIEGSHADRLRPRIAAVRADRKGD